MQLRFTYLNVDYTYTYATHSKRLEGSQVVRGHFSSDLKNP